MAPSWLWKPSAATVRVKKATNRLLLDPDWTINMEICDSINSEPLQAKDVLKAVKKRLHNKKPRVQFLALMVLETIIKNCGDFLPFHVIDCEILQDMVKIARKTTDMQVRVNILVLLDTWQETFGGPRGKYPQYYFAYAELKTSGIKFPQHQKDVALKYTHATRTYQPQVGYAMPNSSAERPDEVVTSERAELSLSDLNNVRNIITLFIDMLHAVIQEGHWAFEGEVITDIAKQCRINQKKLIRLINSTQNEELLREALALNDNLQNALAKHDTIASGSPLPLEEADEFSRPWTLPHAPSISQQFMDREVEEDFTAFSYLAHSDYNFNSTGDQLGLSNRSYYTTATSNSDFSETSLSDASNALVQLHTPKKEEDIINLVSLPLLPDPYPETSSAQSPPSNKNQYSFSTSPCWQQHPSYPQPLRPNQGYTASDSDIAPWSVPAAAKLNLLPPPTMPQQQVTHPGPLWTYTPGVNSNPLLSTISFQHPALHYTMASAPAIPVTSLLYPASQSTTAPAIPVTSLLYPASQSTTAPAIPVTSLLYPASQSTTAPAIPVTSLLYPASQSTTAPAIPVTSLLYPASQSTTAPAFPKPFQDTKAIYNSFGSTEMQGNANNLKQTAASMVAKPYIMPDKFFKDLIELRNPDGSLKSRNASN